MYSLVTIYQYQTKILKYDDMARRSFGTAIRNLRESWLEKFRKILGALRLPERRFDAIEATCPNGKHTNEDYYSII